jgi:restriction system protein
LAGERDAEKPSVPSRQEPDADTEEDIDTTTQEDAEEGAVGRFPLEQHLERFMVANWDQIDFGEPLSLYRDEDGTPGEQYTTDVGIIDLLATDAKGDFVIIELKRGKSTQHVVGQILAYMGWVRRNLATNGQGVRGVVIASDSNAALDEALKEVGDKVIVLHYRVHLELLVPVQK